MNTKKTFRLFLMGMFLAGVACESVHAKDTGVERKLNKETQFISANDMDIERKLNKEIKIELNDVLITEAFGKISKEIDVPIVLSDEAEFKLPYGRSTRLSVTLKGPASESLTQMLNEFFMRYAVGRFKITIYPRPEMDHIVGRPSARQLGVLKALYTMPIKVYITDNVSATLNTALDQEVFISPIEIHETINKTLRRLCGERQIVTARTTEGNKPIYEIKLPLDAEGKESKEYTLPTAVILPQLLRDVLLGNRQVDWYIPSNDLPNQTPEIRIVESGVLSGLMRNQLIDVNFEDKTLMEIFQNLADRGNIRYDKNSKVIPYLDERATLSMQNVTAMQAMKKIADMVQLRYESDGYSEFFIHEKIQPQPPTAAPAAPAKPQASPDDRGPYVGKISIPMDGGKYYIEYMLRESDLTEELKKLRTEKIKEILGSQAKEVPPLPTDEQAR
jgi:hypothetical protein